MVSALRASPPASRSRCSSASSASVDRARRGRARPPPRGAPACARRRRPAAAGSAAATWTAGARPPRSSGSRWSRRPASPSGSPRSGSSASCWVEENRCTSSMNSTVSAPAGGQPAAGVLDHRAHVLDPGGHARTARRTGAPPLAATRYASVVLPVPGGPQSTTEDGAARARLLARATTSRRSGEPGAEQVVLPGDLVQRPRPHPDGERRALDRRPDARPVSSPRRRTGPRPQPTGDLRPTDVRRGLADLGC